jgi:hypothetical protein
VHCLIEDAELSARLVSGLGLDVQLKSRKHVPLSTEKVAVPDSSRPTRASLTFEGDFMKRHIQNLQRLSQKLQNRYGHDDELVVQLSQEIKALQAKQSALTEGFNHIRTQQEWRKIPAPVH